jgi:hypothetical protein
MTHDRVTHENACSIPDVERLLVVSGQPTQSPFEYAVIDGRRVSPMSRSRIFVVLYPLRYTYRRKCLCIAACMDVFLQVHL